MVLSAVVEERAKELKDSFLLYSIKLTSKLSADEDRKHGLNRPSQTTGISTCTGSYPFINPSVAVSEMSLFPGI